MSLDLQAFAGSPLNRSLTEHKQPHFLADVLELATAEVLLVANGRSLCVGQRGECDKTRQSFVKWFHPQDLSELGIINHSGCLSSGGGDLFSSFSDCNCKDFPSDFQSKARDGSKRPGPS